MNIRSWNLKCCSSKVCTDFLKICNPIFVWRYLCKNGLILFPLHNRESGTNKLYDILDCDKLDALSTLNLKLIPPAFEWSLNGSVSSLFWWINVQIWPKYKVFIWLYSNGLLTMNLINLVSVMRPQCGRDFCQIWALRL